MSNYRGLYLKLALIFSLLSCTIGPSVKDIVLYPIKKQPVEFPLELYVTDQYTPAEVKSLDKACSEWKKATDGVASFNIYYPWDPPENFSEYVFLDYPKRTIWKGRTIDPNVTELIMKHGFFDGVQKGNFILVLDDFGDISYNKLHIILKHELGHMIGLEHLRTEYMGLMHIGANQGIITKYDMIQFCSLYSCR